VSRALRLGLAVTIACWVQGSGFRVQGSFPVQGSVVPETRSVRVGFLNPGGGYTVTSIPIETYVARVLAGEAMRDSQPAALEALAITIRTFAAANLKRHGADGFDLCDQTHCQVVRAAVAATERAAQATAGRLLLRNGVPAVIYYTASCGGRTEIPSDVWPGAEDPPFLPSRADDACEGAPAWTASLGEEDLLRALRAGGFRGDRLRDIRIASRNASGRVAQLTLDGLRPGIISGQDLRVVVGRTLGWQHIKSTVFDLRRQGDSYRFTGRGSGHGVGMCVIGSAKLAERGTTAAAILARYFPGLKISGVTSAAALTSAPGRPTGSGMEVLVSLPDDDEGERAAIVRDTARARDEVARALGVTPPTRVTLRFHPTTNAYEKATGQPWFTSGTLVRGEIHVLPLATLRDRGLVDRTIRHGLVHLMTDTALAQRPAWVREGAAIFYAGDAPPAPAGTRPRPAFKPEPRTPCPDDIELLRPVSVGALSYAYARARACFEKQIAGGRSWRDVR
jgi:stage II sporulation protein D